MLSRVSNSQGGLQWGSGQVLGKKVFLVFLVCYIEQSRKKNKGQAIAEDHSSRQFRFSVPQQEERAPELAVPWLEVYVEFSGKARGTKTEERKALIRVGKVLLPLRGKQAAKGQSEKSV